MGKVYCVVMPGLLNQLWRFLTTMDAKAATSLFVSVVLLGFVVLMFFFGEQWLGVQEDSAVNELLLRAQSSPWAVLIVISVYVLLALTGFPQILMIGATVVAFGPVNGAVYAWIATLTSAVFTFGLGRFFGGDSVVRYGGERAAGLISFVSRHGILASGLVRVVPSAPFIVINAAAGAAHIPLWKYLIGTGAGIMPKIGLVATLHAVAFTDAELTNGINDLVGFFTSRRPQDIALIALIIVLWLIFLLGVRRLYLWLRRDR